MECREHHYCNGTTNKGVPCRRIGKYKSDGEHYCHLHVPRLSSDCIICMTKLFDVAMVPCGHRFHYHCVQKWTRYNNTCPICRTPIFYNINKEDYRTILNKYVGEELELVQNIALCSSSSEELYKHLIELDMYKSE